jgi:dephospho-CoA kinase
MSKIIELCGIPGVGKSSVYYAMSKAWNKDKKWVPADFLLPQQKINLRNPKAFVVSLSKRISKVMDAPLLKDAGIRFVEKYPEYINGSWGAINRKHINREDGPDVRLKEASRLKKSTEYIQYLKENKSSKYALLDIGGLVQRLDFTWFNSKDLIEDQREIVSLLGLMPLPEAIIYMYVDEKTNVERLLNRGKRLAIHKKMTDKELQNFCKKYQQRWEFVCNVLNEKNVPLLKIHANKPISDIKVCINEFVEKLLTSN